MAERQAETDPRKLVSVPDTIIPTSKKIKIVTEDLRPGVLIRDWTLVERPFCVSPRLRIIDTERVSHVLQPEIPVSMGIVRYLDLECDTKVDRGTG